MALKYKAGDPVTVHFDWVRYPGYIRDYAGHGNYDVIIFTKLLYGSDTPYSAKLIPLKTRQIKEASLWRLEGWYNYGQAPDAVPAGFKYVEAYKNNSIDIEYFIKQMRAVAKDAIHRKQYLTYDPSAKKPQFMHPTWDILKDREWPRNEFAAV